LFAFEFTYIDSELLVQLKASGNTKMTKEASGLCDV